MSARYFRLPIWVGSALCTWAIASCAQPVDDTGWVGQNTSGGSGGALVGGAAGSNTGGGGSGGAAGEGGTSPGGSANAGGGSTGGFSGGGTGGASGGGTGGYSGGSTGGYSGGSTGGYSGGGTGGSGGGGDCLLQASDPTCDSCLNSQCYSECAVCSANQSCLDLLDCITYCSGNPYCEDDCTYYYYDGVDDLLALLGSTSGCLTLKCSAACQ